MKKLLIGLLALGSLSAFAEICVDTGICAKALVETDNAQVTIVHSPYIKIAENFKINLKPNSNKNKICKAYELGKYVNGSAKIVRKDSFILHGAQVSKFESHRVIDEITCSH